MKPKVLIIVEGGAPQAWVAGNVDVCTVDLDKISVGKLALRDDKLASFSSLLTPDDWELLCKKIITARYMGATQEDD